MKKRTIASTTLFVATALALVLSLATTFSWFSSRFVTEEFTFTTAKLASTVTLYKAQDFDLDGYPDMVIGADNASSYEIFIPQTDNSTEQIKETIDGQETVVAERKYTSLVIDNMHPSEVHTFKITVANNGTVDSKLIALFSSDSIATNDFVKTLVATPVMISSLDHTITYGDPFYLKDMTQQADSSLYIAEFLKQSTLGDITKDSNFTEVKIGETKDFYFTVRMMTYEELTEFYPDFDYDVYQAYQGINYTLSLSVILEAEDFH
jgi:hypothetical protein